MYLFLDYLEVLLVALLICIFCDVEQNDFENYKNIHRIAYNQSYVVSKMYLENSLRENSERTLNDNVNLKTVKGIRKLVVFLTWNEL